jgi:superfamily I DNA/RNA helicase
MRILGRQNVLEAIGRIPRPLNRFETEPLLYDLPAAFGNKRARNKRIRAYEAAWARLQHELPGHAPNAQDQAFENALVSWLRFHRGMLIGEIIPHVYRYLRDNPGAPERNLYDHILVDEYQDLNKAEQAVIDLLSNTAHLCIVGDDDQSLYSFKFAHPAGIRSFPATHPDTRDHEVLECRRCPTRIVEMANSLIAHNQDRESRQLTPWPSNGPGHVAVVQYQTLNDEAVGIAEFIADLTTNQGYAPQDILVLAQRRSIGNPIHDALTGRNIPSKSYYQEGALDSVSAQERLAILKLFLDPQDRIALRCASYFTQPYMGYAVRWGGNARWARVRPVFLWTGRYSPPGPIFCSGPEAAESTVRRCASYARFALHGIGRATGDSESTDICPGNDGGRP